MYSRAFQTSERAIGIDFKPKPHSYALFFLLLALGADSVPPHTRELRVERVLTGRARRFPLHYRP